MEKIEWSIAQLKEHLSSLPRTRSGNLANITDEIRKAAVVAFESSDLLIKEFSSQIGISESCFNRWLRDFRAKNESKPRSIGFRKIKIEPQSGGTEPSKGLFALEGPQGLRMSGLNISEVALIWRSLC